MLKNPASKYRPFHPVSLPDRRWPDRVLTAAPTWCSVDLRDGNQALAVPMNVSQKLELFDALVKCGFKEIEVGYGMSLLVGRTLSREALRGLTIWDLGKLAVEPSCVTPPARD